MKAIDDKAASRTALYRFYNPDGDLLYVGISVRPWTRWKQHKGQKDWAEEVATQTIEWWPTRAEALVAEKEAIIAEEPIYNVVHNGTAATLTSEPTQTFVSWLKDQRDGRGPISRLAWDLFCDDDFRGRSYESLRNHLQEGGHDHEKAVLLRARGEWLAEANQGVDPVEPIYEFYNRGYAGVRATRLYLVPEPDGLAILSHYDLSEIPGWGQVRIYANHVLNYLDGGAGSEVPEMIPVHWAVEGPDAAIFETAPVYRHRGAHNHVVRNRSLTENGIENAMRREGDERDNFDNFISHYSWPVDSETGDQVSFYRLPVMHRFPAFWRALGYELSPLQPYMPTAVLAS